MKRTPADQETFQSATAEQRQLLRQLAAVARAILTESGRAPDSGALETVENNLRWGAISPQARPSIESGRLIKDVPPPGFTALLGGGDDDISPPPSRPPAPARVKDKTIDKAEKAAAAEEAREEQRRAAALRAELTRAQNQVAQARRNVDHHDKAVHTHKTRIQKLEADLTAAREALTAAQAAHEEAVETLETQRQELERLTAEGQPGK
jgi:hypothetical protein